MEFCYDTEYPIEFSELIKSIIEQFGSKENLDILFGRETDIKKRAEIMSTFELNVSQRVLDFIKYICNKYIERVEMGDITICADNDTKSGIVISEIDSIKQIFTENLNFVNKIIRRKQALIDETNKRVRKKPASSKSNKGTNNTSMMIDDRNHSIELAKKISGASSEKREEFIKKFINDGYIFYLDDAVEFVDPTKSSGKEILIHLLINNLITGKDIIEYIGKNCEQKSRQQILKDLISIKQTGYFNGKNAESDDLTLAYVNETVNNGHQKDTE